MRGMFLFLSLVVTVTIPILWAASASLTAASVAQATATSTPRSAFFPLVEKRARLDHTPTVTPPRPPGPSPTATSRTPTPTVSRTPLPVSTPFCGMSCRLEYVVSTLNRPTTCEAVDKALDEGMEILYGGLRPLRSKGLLDQTQVADTMVTEAETKLAQALQRLTQTELCPAQQDRALDLKLFIEQMSEVAQAVGAITSRCGLDDSLTQPPCDELQPLLDEDTGRELSLTTPAQTTIRPSYAVKLRSPLVPPWSSRWEEDVRVTEPIPAGQCVVIPKETRGLMLRLHFDRVSVVTDPWVTVFGVPRGTLVPIWRLEWVGAQYMKEWNLCNPNGTGIVKTVTQRVVQDIPLTYFWRFYRKDP